MKSEKNIYITGKGHGLIFNMGSVKFSNKCLKTPFLACFLKSLPAVHKFYRVHILFLENSENEVVDLKKKTKRSAKLSKFLEKPPKLFEKLFS